MKVVDVYDGDTITVAFVFHGAKYIHKLRLAGIDTPELHPRKSIPNRNEIIERAQRAKERMVELCLNKIVRVHCDGWDKYGRLLGTVYANTHISVNQIMIDENFAYEYDGGAKRSI